MHVLFVNGLGLTTYSGSLLLHRLRRAGYATSAFAYSASLASFDTIVARLRVQLAAIANASVGEYVVVGHSLGGVLLRAAINSMPPDFVPPRHSFLIGSPILASRLAQRFKNNPVWRLLAGDCGQLLGTPSRMNSIGALAMPTTAIIGVGGFTGRLSPFGDDVNDSRVSVSEASAPWLSDVVEVKVIHGLMPLRQPIIEIILRKLNTLL